MQIIKAWLKRLTKIKTLDMPKMMKYIQCFKDRNREKKNLEIQLLL